MIAEAAAAVNSVTPLRFFELLKWLDGRALLDHVQAYRRRIFEEAFSVDAAGVPRYSLVLAGRSKKNGKSLDLVLAALYSLLLRDSVQGAGGYVLANDLDQAADDLDLAKKLIRANPSLDSELTVRTKEVERRNGNGVLVILPARDVAAHTARRRPSSGTTRSTSIAITRCWMRSRRTRRARTC